MTTTPDSIDNELDTILMTLAIANVSREHPTKIGEAKAQLIHLIEGIIGNDDQLHSKLDPKAWDVSRNKLRAEQRAKLKALGGGDE